MSAIETTETTQVRAPRRGSHQNVSPWTVNHSGQRADATQAGEAATAPAAESVAAPSNAVSTTMFTTETPAVVESSDHHLIGESVPITHSTSPHPLTQRVSPTTTSVRSLRPRS